MNRKDMEQKMRQWIDSLEDDKENEWFCTHKFIANEQMLDFLDWLDRKTYSHDEGRVYFNYTNREFEDQRVCEYVGEFTNSTLAAAYVDMMNEKQV